MKDYQQRVVVERTELDQKLSRLRAFISSEQFQTVAAFEQVRLLRQQDIMQQYLAVLDERIADFET